MLIGGNLGGIWEICLVLHEGWKWWEAHPTVSLLTYEGQGKIMPGTS